MACGSESLFLNKTGRYGEGCIRGTATSNKQSNKNFCHFLMLQMIVNEPHLIKKKKILLTSISTKVTCIY